MFGEVNIVTPVTSSKASVVVDFARLPDLGLSTGDQGDDEFCAFIDEHIHLVSNDGIDSFGMHETAPIGLSGILAMDECIEHCRLPY
jgi:hypothetical protein